MVQDIRVRTGSAENSLLQVDNNFKNDPYLKVRICGGE
jgi:hypothetical protein